MFGRKKKKQQKGSGAEQKIAADITTIPRPFYGGADPQIYHAAAQQKKEHVSKKIPKKKTSSSPVQKNTRPAPHHGSSRRKWWIIGAVVLLLLFTGGASWYYISQAQPDTPAPTPTPTPQPVVLDDTEPAGDQVPEREPEPDPVPEPDPEPEPEAITDFPRLVLVDTADLDADSLTDLEEEIFDTDSGVWDTDGDGYYDGQEISNLYNPRGFAPVLLVDSGLIREYTNPDWGYRVYYPIGWEAAEVGNNGDHVLFSAITGDYVEILATEREPGESFAQWFSRSAVGERITDLSTSVTRFEVESKIRRDSLVAYIEDGDTIFTMVYQPGGAGLVPFRHIMEMMIQSFRPGTSTAVLPEQPVLPVPGAPAPPLESETTTTTS